MKFYVSALVGVITEVILQNARCNNKDWATNVYRYKDDRDMVMYMGLILKSSLIKSDGSL